MPAPPVRRFLLRLLPNCLPERRFWLTACLLGQLLLLFAILRGALWLRCADLADDASASEIAAAFWYGLWFDLSVAAYATLAAGAVCETARLVWGPRGERGHYLGVWTLYALFFSVAGLGEIEFYREFFVRFNSLAITYWREPTTVASMIWHGYPVLPYLAAAIVLTALFAAGTAWWVRRWLGREEATLERQHWGRRIAGIGLSAALLLVAVRGGLRGAPLSWGDAIHCHSSFANELAANGIWNLGQTLLHERVATDTPGGWRHNVPHDVATQRARELLVLPGERLLGDSAALPLLRTPTAQTRSVRLQRVSDQPPNVVVIIMESFSARFVGALGSPDDQTPHFNRLAAEGVLFSRCFSNGTHTHQGAYGVLAGFPNLPGYETLMEDSELGGRPFDSLPRSLRRRGYRTMFLYNGDFAWENMRGFFRLQGIDRFIGRGDFDDTSYFDPTWGVSDKELLERANAEFREQQEPFFAAILTLSNHAPFKLPRPLPFPETTDRGRDNDRLNGIRFADWALGHFFKLARKEAYFRNTLFVLVGDHGFSVTPNLAEFNLLRFHVPLLFYAPELLGTQGRLIPTVAGHVSIAPTIRGLLGDQAPQQHWGRDLFAIPPGDPGFAVFKPSGDTPDVGFAKGDYLLIRSPRGQARLYRYDLGFPPRAAPVDAEHRGIRERMELELRSYLQVATHTLCHGDLIAPPIGATVADQGTPAGVLSR